jgi:hypothetical protein
MFLSSRVGLTGPKPNYLEWNGNLGTQNPRSSPTNRAQFLPPITLRRLPLPRSLEDLQSTGHLPPPTTPPPPSPSSPPQHPRTPRSPERVCTSSMLSWMASLPALQAWPQPPSSSMSGLHCIDPCRPGWRRPGPHPAGLDAAAAILELQARNALQQHDATTTTPRSHTSVVWI